MASTLRLGRSRAFGMLSSPKGAAVAASAAGQMLMFASIAFVSRHFNSTELAIYGLFSSLFNIAQIVITLRLEQAIMYERDDGQAKVLMAMCLAVAPFSGAIIFLFACVYLYLNPLSSPSAVAIAASLAFAGAGAGGSRLAGQWLARSDRFYLLSFLNFARLLTIAVALILATFFKHEPYTLPTAYALGQVALASMVLSRSKLALRAPTRDQAAQALRDHRGFVVFGLPQNLLFVFSEAIVPLSLSFIFSDPRVLALFWMATRAVFAPASIVAESVRPQIYRAVSKDRHGLLSTMLRYAAGLGFFCLIPFCILLLAGPPLFGLVFGHQWMGANSYALILAVLIALNMVAMPFIGAVPVLKLQWLVLVFEVLGLITRCGLLYLVHWNSPLTALAFATGGYVTVMMCFMLIVGIVAQRFQKQYPNTDLGGR